MQGPGRGPQALRQQQVFPSPGLQAMVEARLKSAEDLLQSIADGSLPADGLSGALMPVLRTLASTLQRVGARRWRQLRARGRRLWRARVLHAATACTTHAAAAHPQCRFDALVPFPGFFFVRLASGGE